MQIKKPKYALHTHEKCQKRNTRKNRNDYILARCIFYSIFCVRALHATGCKPALNIGISRFDHTNIGTSVEHRH